MLNMTEVLERLYDLNDKLPRRFSREYAGRVGQITGLLGWLAERANPVKEVKALLSSEEMSNLIESGHITIAMIKPSLDIHMHSPNMYLVGDPELTDYLIGQIPENLEPVLSVSLQMTESMLDEFYAGKPKNRMQEVKGNNHGTSRWDDFRELMASGPVTFLLLYAPEGNGIQTWRDAMGGSSWDVNLIKRDEPDSLRARFAIGNDNNLLHGSDSPESALRELEFIIRHMS
jgi:nucleoside diphosphate kinase